MKNDQSNRSTAVSSKAGKRTTLWEKTRFAGIMPFASCEGELDAPTISLARCWHVEASAGYDIARDLSGFHLLFRSLSGAGHLLYEDNMLTVAEGECAIVEGNRLARYGCATPHWTSWQFQFRLEGDLAVPLGVPMRISVRPEDYGTVEDIFRHVRRVDNVSQRLASARFAALLYDWAVRWQDASPPTPHAQAIQRVVAMMHERVATGFPVSAMAREAHLSESHFRRVFLKQTGMGPKQYYDGLRLHAAEAALRAGATITQVADRFCFSSAFHFSSAFKQHMGVPPSHITQRQREAPPTSNDAQCSP